MALKDSKKLPVKSFATQGLYLGTELQQITEALCDPKFHRFCCYKLLRWAGMRCFPSLELCRSQHGLSTNATGKYATTVVEVGETSTGIEAKSLPRNLQLTEHSINLMKLK